MGSYTWYQDLRSIAFGEGEDPNTTWIDLASEGAFSHALYGDLAMTATKLKAFADSFNQQVRGHAELPIDYDHSPMKSGSTEAAGWLKKVVYDPATRKLRGLVTFTETAAKKIKEGAYRYFSPEFRDEWTDNSGTKHMNVLFGGGLTNRPFLKDLLPINLSELTFTNDPFPSNVPPKKENEVDPKALRAKIGLAEDATEEQVTERLGLIKALSEAFPSGPPAPPKNDPPKPAPTALPDEIKALAESSPVAKALVAHMEDLSARFAEQQVALREAEVSKRLHEFDNSKVALTPVAKEKAAKILSDPHLPQALMDDIYDLMTMMRDSQSFVVELGERASSYSRRRNERPASVVFSELVEKEMASSKLGYADAVEKVARENATLYDEYRNESFLVRE